MSQKLPDLWMMLLNAATFFFLDSRRAQALIPWVFRLTLLTHRNCVQAACSAVPAWAMPQQQRSGFTDFSEGSSLFHNADWALHSRAKGQLCLLLTARVQKCSSVYGSWVKGLFLNGCCDALRPLPAERPGGRRSPWHSFHRATGRGGWQRDNPLQQPQGQD